MKDALILGAMAVCFLLLVASLVAGRIHTDRSAHGAQIPHPRKHDPRNCLTCSQMRHPSQTGLRRQVTGSMVSPRRSTENGGRR
ncbi:hypothetical protein [Streptomyces carpinensis]|uniref:Secreted protein n=1 Tax=Streptomyces carpinensis TaxID=66369 RepID=A0ABV1VVQ5_9ACTN|nr:hypothetical protein [Streptomyces carpinensis]